jgi:hypothetical protein
LDGRGQNRKGDQQKQVSNAVKYAVARHQQQVSPLDKQDLLPADQKPYQADHDRNEA